MVPGITVVSQVWIFDVAGGEGRLLRFRMGHSAPPTKIKHYDQSGQHILSASTAFFGTYLLF